MVRTSALNAGPLPLNLAVYRPYFHFAAAAISVLWKCRELPWKSLFLFNEQAQEANDLLLLAFFFRARL
jgi:hypothetical protein